VPPAPKLCCRFFRTQQGHEPVRKWFKSLPGEVTKEIGAVSELLEGQTLRTRLAGKQMPLVLLHGFLKKARTEPDDIALGWRRQRQIAQEDIP
jgi:hypothetical protein